LDKRNQLIQITRETRDTLKYSTNLETRDTLKEEKTTAWGQSKVTLTLYDPLNPIGLLGTDPSFNETRQHFAEAALLLSKMGEVSMSLSRLIAEQHKRDTGHP
jgi:hypothetical protein